MLKSASPQAATHTEDEPPPTASDPELDKKQGALRRFLETVGLREGENEAVFHGVVENLM